MKKLLAITLCVWAINGIFAQIQETKETPIAMTIDPYKKGEVPTWAKDLRRAEIITLGSMPFAMLGVNMITSAVTWAQSGFDFAKFPNPMNPSPDTGELTEDEIYKRIWISLGISL
ncbi:MAG: hypothetical protein ACRC5H_07480, partial [Treponemataceae bacterium]